MTLYKQALILGSAMWFAASGVYASVPDIGSSMSGASGAPGEVVHSTLVLEISGFDFDSFTLDLAYDPQVMTFLPGASTVSFNGATIAFSALPNFSPPTGDFDEVGDWHAYYSSFSLNPVPVIGNLVLTGAFQIAGPGAGSPIPGDYLVRASGSVTTDLVYEERFFNAESLVSVVPEPESWLFWLGGVGLVALRLARSRR